MTQELWLCQRRLLEEIDSKQQYQKALDMAVDMNFPLPSGIISNHHESGNDVSLFMDDESNGVQGEQDDSDDDKEELNISVKHSKKRKRKRKSRLKEEPSTTQFNSSSSNSFENSKNGSSNYHMNEAIGQSHNTIRHFEDIELHGKMGVLVQQSMRNKGLLSLYTALLAIKSLFNNCSIHNINNSQQEEEETVDISSLCYEKHDQYKQEVKWVEKLSKLIKDTQNYQKKKNLSHHHHTESNRRNDSMIDYERVGQLLTIVKKKLSEAYQYYPSHFPIAYWSALVTSCHNNTGRFKRRKRKKKTNRICSC